MIIKDRRNIEDILLRFLNDRAFSGCALGVSRLRSEGFERLHVFAGKADEENNAEEVNKRSFFDVASLTKPLVTVLSILSLVKEGKICFEEKLETLLPVNIPADKKRIDVIHLLSHRSGLPSHREYYRKAVDGEVLCAEKLVEIILQEKLENKPGEKYIYSDLDYMLLGEIIKWKSGESIESYWRKRIVEPLFLSENFRCQGFKKGENEDSFVSTGKCSWSKVALQGEVHDDNCRAVQEMMGHAGLFATLGGIMHLCEDILLNYLGRSNHPSYERDDLLYILNRKNNNHRVAGFDVVTGESPSSGKYFSTQTIGHLGFTGTSFWIDLKKKILIVLLTNRVICGADKRKIQEMRPRIHDAVMENLIKDNF
nr:serine hydrolase [Desulfopila inferna]